jgi:DNA-binding response OmpR family regulator
MARALVIDDEPGIREILRFFLETAGWSVRLAPNGPEGLAAAAADPPDVVLLDAMMPGMDGFEVARRMREAGLVAPIFMLTASGARAPDLQAAGIDRYFTKPFDGAEVIAALDAIRG